MGTNMHNSHIKRNCNCIKERLKQWVDNYIYLVLNIFRHVQTAFNAIFSKYNSNKSCKSPTCTCSESQISTFKVFKRKKVHFTTKINLKFQASEKVRFIKSDSQNGTRSSILERSICLEMNKKEFWSESSE
jgi:hypothetical protein